ncbi:MAG: TetR family transcriptional regulator [Cyclobacteriaceae bacterium]|nr:TetR family transcriptional regulator [Cyclobacteriaceae bacterium]
MVKSKNTEEKILDSAREIFMMKGFEGARMQEIADHAGINKALLHYYFRSKEKLFASIFNKILSQIGPAMLTFINEEIPLEVKIWKFVDSYLELMKKFPRMPLFIINEISINPERIIGHLNFSDFLDLRKLEKILHDEHGKGRIIAVDVKHFIVNIIGLTVFPLAAKIIIQRNLQIQNDEWHQFIEERKKVIPETIMGWLKNMD